jgi:hypothetical protein
MLGDQSRMRVSADAVLGDPLLTQETMGGSAPQPAPLPAVLPFTRLTGTDLTVRVGSLEAQLAALTARVATLETGWWARTWARLVAWWRTRR